MTGYVAKNTTLVKLTDNSGYANYSEVANADTLAFQYLQYPWDSVTETPIATGQDLS